MGLGRRAVLGLINSRFFILFEMEWCVARDGKLFLHLSNTASPTRLGTNHAVSLFICFVKTLSGLVMFV